MGPAEIVDRWFDAHERADVDAARTLMDPAATITVGTVQLHGFDELRRWYTNRAADAGPDFSYRRLDLMTGEHRVAVLLELTDGIMVWEQLSMYAIERQRISTMWVIESEVRKPVEPE